MYIYIPVSFSLSASLLFSPALFLFHRQPGRPDASRHPRLTPPLLPRHKLHVPIATSESSQSRTLSPSCGRRTEPLRRAPGQSGARRRRRCCCGPSAAPPRRPPRRLRRRNRPRRQRAARRTAPRWSPAGTGPAGPEGRFRSRPRSRAGPTAWSTARCRRRTRRKLLAYRLRNRCIQDTHECKDAERLRASSPPLRHVTGDPRSAARRDSERSYQCGHTVESGAGHAAPAPHPPQCAGSADVRRRDLRPRADRHHRRLDERCVSG